MRSFSFRWSEELGKEIRKQCPKAGYSMSLGGDDRNLVMLAVNQGIDSHLEACFVPERGDSYEWETPPGAAGRVSGTRLECVVSPESLPVLVRRLFESDDEKAEALASDICASLEIELI